MSILFVLDTFYKSGNIKLVTGRAAIMMSKPLGSILIALVVLFGYCLLANQGLFDWTTRKLEPFGFINQKGNMIFNLREFDKNGTFITISDFNDDFCRISSLLPLPLKHGARNESAGCSYLNKRGELLATTAALISGRDFSDGLAGVYVLDNTQTLKDSTLVTRNWWYLNSNGKVSLGPFSEVQDFSEGLAAVKNIGDKYWRYIDKAGTERCFGQFEDATRFACGRAAVYVNGKWGLIASSGKTILSPTYKDKIRPFHENFTAVEMPSKNQVLYLNRDGQVQLSVHRSNSIHKKFLHYDPAKGIFSVQIDKPYNASSVEINEPSYDVSDGLIVIEKSGKFGYGDLNGNIVVTPRFDYCWPFSEGRARVYRENSEAGLFGYIDRLGNEIIPCKYIEASTFSEGYAVVIEHDYLKSKYIDQTGRNVFNKTFPAAKSFHNGFAFVGRSLY